MVHPHLRNQRMRFLLLFQIFNFMPWLVALAAAVPSAYPSIPITRPGCKESCNNSDIKIPFPFGIGHGCYHDPWYEIVCNSSSSKPFLRKFSLEVLNISSCLSNTPDNYLCFWDGLNLEVAGHWQTLCPNEGLGNSSVQRRHMVKSIDFQGSPFHYSYRNAFVMEGCEGHGVIMNRSNHVVGGCSTVCPPNNTTPAGSQGTTTDITTTSCDGVGCCSASLCDISSLDFYQINLTEADSCIKVALMQQLSESRDSIRTILDWTPPLLLENTSRGIICDPGASTCRCSYRLVGNPYIPYGCRDPCQVGPYDSADCKKPLLKLSALLGLSIGLGSLVLLLCSYGLWRLIKRVREARRRAKFFKRNGGLLLQQQMTSTKGAVERTRVFTASELEKATDYFSASRILGQGGQGTVYKGMLLDGRVVAVKKSKKVDKSQLEEFINEVVILSQINHRNVVPLLGCCLETEVPLLVYEYVTNGPLSQHIHNASGGDLHITWKMRMRIAAESASAISYLHSSSAMPIYHRDIKSSNILLDDKYRAKVSDFGTSRTIMIEQTHLTTCVQGTMGYLDPEYFQSNQFTEKSDVYSFGVVLVELLTSKKPLSPTGRFGGWKSLAMEFLAHMENASLFEILDAQMVKEAEEEELVSTVANLAMRCLNFKGKLRPTMKEVVTTLEAVSSPNQPSGTQQARPKGHDMVMEISSTSDNSAYLNTFFSENRIDGSYSIAIQPLVHNTL